MPQSESKCSQRRLPSRKTLLLLALSLIIFVAASRGELYVIAHLPYGGGWGSRIVITNPGAEAVRGELKFFSKDGQPVPPPVSGEEWRDSYPFEIGCNAVQSLEMNAGEPGSEVQLAWATAETNAPLQISSFFGFRSPDRRLRLGVAQEVVEEPPVCTPPPPPGPVTPPCIVPLDPGSPCIPSVPVTTPLVSVQITTVASSVSLPKGRSFQAPVSVYGSMGNDARFAFTNPNETTATVRVILVRPEGYESVSRMVQIGPYRQVNHLLTDPELFGLELAPAVRFQGSIMVCSDVPIGILALGLEGKNAYTLPVAAGNRCPGELRRPEDQSK